MFASVSAPAVSQSSIPTRTKEKWHKGEPPRMRTALHEEDPLLYPDAMQRGAPVNTSTSSTDSFLTQLISDTHIRLKSFALGTSFHASSQRSNQSSTGSRNGRRQRKGRRHHGQRIEQAQLILGFMYISILLYSLVIMLGPLYLFLRPQRTWCPYDDETSPEVAKDVPEYENPDYMTDPCRTQLRLPFLLCLTLEECDFSRRLLVSVLLGSMIGYERRSADRPAGIRTMGLVSLGACFFTIRSIQAFRSSPMGWDASRVTAALPSGVGFLGGALIWKGTVLVGQTGEEKHQVHGLTTAASLWLSAAMGVGAGGALYAVTFYATVLVVLVLRFGPKMYNLQDHEDDEDAESQEEDNENESHDNESLEKQDEDPKPENIQFQALTVCTDDSDTQRASLASPRKTPISRRRTHNNIPTFGS